MAFKTLNPENPLAQYRVANYNKDWDEVTKESGVSKQQLFRIVKYTTERAGVLSLKSVVKFYANLSVDFVSFMTGGEYKIIKTDPRQE